jgi:acid phosphatase
VYDHVVVVVEENKNFAQIVGNKSAPYINALATEGASFSRMFGEEHSSQGNYFWLFSGSNQGVGFHDIVPSTEFTSSSLGEQLIKKQLSFKGYAEGLPAIGATVELDPPGCDRNCVYGRKHVPWISFAGIPKGATAAESSNLRLADFPADYAQLPTVAFVIPDLNHDMHNGKPEQSIPAADAWLKEHLDPYYQWAKTHNSLLIVTFDENDDKAGYHGLTDPGITPVPGNELQLDMQNRIATIFAGAHIKPGEYAEGTGITHVNILRTIEAMYGLPKSGAQQQNATAAGISDDKIVMDVFEPAK